MKCFEDPDFGTVRLVKSARARNLSLRVHPLRGVTVTLPRWAPYAAGMAFFRARRDWVAAQWNRGAAVRDAFAAEQATFDAEACRKAAKAYLPDRLRYWADRYGFTYGKVFIKHNRSNWGSCSAKGNINLNLNLMRLPEAERDYVLLHELAHLRHPNHGPDFHVLLDTLCQDALGRPARDLEKSVKSYPIL